MIRSLALLLLLANLAYHLWSLQRPPPAGSAPPPKPLPPSAERLLLLSERSAGEAAAGPGRTPEAPAAAAPPADARAEPRTEEGAGAEAPTVTGGPTEAPAAGSPAEHCERIGPLGPELAARLLEALRQAGGRAAVVADADAQGDGAAATQLYVPAPASFAEAREIVRALGEAGLEAYVMGRDEISGAVSVGLFTEPGRARDRRARVEALGYVVAERELAPPAERVRIAVRLPAPAIDRALAALGADEGEPPREPVACGPPVSED